MRKNSAAAAPPPAGPRGWAGPIAAAAALLITLPALGEAAVETGVALRENLFHSGTPPIGGLSLPTKGYWVSGTYIRPSLGYLTGPWSLSTAVEFRTVWDSTDAPNTGAGQAGGNPFGGRALLERVDMTAHPVREPHAQADLRVERLKLSRSFSVFDVDLGRQPVTLGTSHFVGVLDVLAPFPPGDLDSTYKPGIDSARGRISVGEEGEAEIIAAAADPWAESAVIGRLRRRVSSLDLEVVVGKFRRRLFGGAGWEGDAGPLAVWGELALFERRLDKEARRGGAHDAAFVGVAGTDWRVAGNTTVGGAFFYNDFGASRTSDLLAVATDAPYREGWAFLGSRSYFVSTFHAEPHALAHFDLAGMVNLVDASTLWQPRLTLNVHDNADISAYGWFATGKRPAGAVPRSEFGSAADGAGVYGRVFF
ncbi:MAG: hypothetical protein ABII00_02620 [Elusimicrobiota bacterium]